MDKEWILTFAFFMIFNNSPEIMGLIKSDNFDEDFNKVLKELESTDAEKLKKLIVDKASDSYEKMKAINEANCQYRRDE